MTTATSTRQPLTTVARVTVAIEVVLAVAAVLLDLLLPTLVLLAVAVLTVLVRREQWAALGLTRPTRPLRLAGTMLLVAVLWTAAHLVLFMPVVERLTGRQQDTGDFTALQGDPGTLALLLLVSWTLAAVGEEVAYRGYLLTRVRQLLGPSTAALVVSVLGTAVVFGLAHTEQGVVGVCLASIDGIAFAVLRLHHRTIWAPVLMHGFSNTIGLTTFFLVGPVTGLW